MNAADSANSEMLLKQAAEGDDHAVRELFELYRGRMSLLEAFQGTSVPCTLSRVTHLCVLVPNDGFDSAPMLKLLRAETEPVLAAKEVNATLPFVAALYRGRQYRASASMLSGIALQLENAGNPMERGDLAQALYFLAMAHYHLENRSEAQRYLGKAADIRQ